MIAQDQALIEWWLKNILKNLGWQWTPTMFIGQGCKVHLKKE